jgi:hypothetical protein
MRFGRGAAPSVSRRFYSTADSLDLRCCARCRSTISSAKWSGKIFSCPCLSRNEACFSRSQAGVLYVWRERYFRAGNRVVSLAGALGLRQYALFSVHAFSVGSVRNLYSPLFSAEAGKENVSPNSGGARSLHCQRDQAILFETEPAQCAKPILVALRLPFPPPSAFCLSQDFSRLFGHPVVSCLIRERTGEPPSGSAPLAAFLSYRRCSLPDRDIEARYLWAASAVFAACCVFIFAPRMGT